MKEVEEQIIAKKDELVLAVKKSKKDSKLDEEAKASEGDNEYVSEDEMDENNAPAKSSDSDTSIMIDAEDDFDEFAPAE